MSGHVEYEDPADQEAWQAHQEHQAGPVCEFCQRPVEPRDYQRVTGWVKGSSRDGFVRDFYLDEWAHKTCIEIQHTVGTDQGGLFR